jgi:hypothetical protein
MSTMCLQAIELNNNSTAHNTFAAAPRHGDLRTTSYAGHLHQDDRWVKQ